MFWNKYNENQHQIENVTRCCVFAETTQKNWTPMKDHKLNEGIKNYYCNRNVKRFRNDGEDQTTNGKHMNLNYATNTHYNNVT